MRHGDFARGAGLDKVTREPAGSPCSRRVSRTEPSAGSATGRSFSGFECGVDLARPGSVDRSQDASALAGSIVPSGSGVTFPVLIARSTATWLTPRSRAYARIDNPMIVPPQTKQSNDPFMHLAQGPIRAFIGRAPA